MSGVTLGAVEGATVSTLKRFKLALAADLSPAKSRKPWVIGWSFYWPTDSSSSD